MEKKPIQGADSEKRPFEEFRAHNIPPGALPAAPSGNAPHSAAANGTKRFVVIGPHRYYNLFSAQLAEAALTNYGDIKNPVAILNPLDLVWNTQRPEELRFYASIARLQAFYEASPSDHEGLVALVSNPLRYDFFLHNPAVSDKVTAKSVSPVRVGLTHIEVKLSASFLKGTFTVKCELYVDKAFCPMARVAVRFDHFLVIDSQWLLAHETNALRVLSYFSKHDGVLQFDHPTFSKFRKEVLSDMEQYVTVEHEYLKPAQANQIAEGGFDKAPAKIIYLDDFADYVTINPVMKYGDFEIPVLSTKQIYGEDKAGNAFKIDRDAEAENDFIATIVKQHPHFLEQMDNPLLYFYLHKTRFLDEDWFLKAFEEWGEQGITTFGFNEIRGNNLNPDKASITIHVASGLNWFNAQVGVKFGKKKASLKNLQKSVKNKSKFVALDDGTLGILPEEWLLKFEEYFAAGEVVDEEIHIPKIGYTSLNDLFEKEMLDEKVRSEISRYHQRLTGFESMTPVRPSANLQTTLRPYQLQGLTWLNFLDDFNFGGCLADDMGLGKTIQIIAFILLLREKHKKSTHLLVVPTSLVHNWQEELEKFAPSIRVLTFYGPNRLRAIPKFDENELIITTYNTLMTDIIFLKKYVFSYIFLDESQNIKNITSQRYKAARMLQSRNKILLTGTPLENNTFDLYAQLSFACPGLLGTRTYFRNTYAMAIDKFKHKHSAQDLQRKVSPFILRRTKKEVAKELPEKTEMVLHCEMGPEQRKIYDAFEKEFREYIAATTEDEIVKTPMHTLRGITRLRQICNSPLLLGDEKLYSTASSKIATLMEQLRNITGEHKVLVFSQFVSMLELIRKELDKESIKYTMLTGSTTHRGEVVNQFQTDEATRVFLISLKAGGTGLNLTGADYVFLVDPWWNPAVENQAIDRSYRIGQEKNVIAVRLICPDTVEEKIQIMQQSKAKLATELIQADNDFFRSMTKGDWLGLLQKS